MPVILALVVVQIIYASGVIVGKFVLPVVPAPVIVTVRMIIASIAFYFAHRAIKGSVPRTAGDWIRFAAILSPMIPIFTVICGWAFWRARPSSLAWAGVAVAAAGTVYLIGPDRVSLAPEVALGNTLVLSGMASNALAFLLAKDMLQRYAPVTVAFCLTLTGLLGIMPLGIGATERHRHRGVPL